MNLYKHKDMVSLPAARPLDWVEAASAARQAAAWGAPAPQSVADIKRILSDTVVANPKVKRSEAIYNDGTIGTFILDGNGSLQVWANATAVSGPPSRTLDLATFFQLKSDDADRHHPEDEMIALGRSLLFPTRRDDRQSRARALKTDDAPPGLKALLVGASDSRGSVLRPPNLTLTRPGALWSQGGSAGFSYNQTYTNLGSYALRFDKAQSVCVSAVDSCTGDQVPAGPTAGPIEPGIGETHASIALLPNRRYIMIAVIRTSFERLTTEINLGVNLFDGEGNSQTDYDRVVGLPSDSWHIPTNVDGWVRWEWEFVTPAGVARGLPFFAEYLRNGTTMPRLELTDLAFVLTPATPLTKFAGATGVTFRGSAGSLPMSVEACSVAGAVTTAANYTFSLGNKTIHALQNIDMPRFNV